MHFYNPKASTRLKPTQDIHIVDDNKKVLEAAKTIFDNVTHLRAITHQSATSLMEDLEKAEGERKLSKTLGVLLDLDLSRSEDKYDHAHEALEAFAPLLRRHNAAMRTKIGVILHTQSDPTALTLLHIYDFRDIVYGFIQKPSSETVISSLPHRTEGIITGNSRDFFWKFREGEILELKKKYDAIKNKKPEASLPRATHRFQAGKFPYKKS